MRLRVYIAGPYTRPDPEENTRLAIRIGDHLLSLGYVPFIPHLTHFWDQQAPRPYEDWLTYDLEWLRTCNAVLRLPGTSSGADRETAEAIRIGIRVFHSIPKLMEVFPP